METLKGKVLADFEGESEEEISLSAGTIVTIVKQDDDGWWTVMTEDGSSGIFPQSYVEIIQTEPTKPNRPRSVAAPSIKREPLAAVASAASLSSSNESVVKIPAAPEPVAPSPAGRGRGAGPAGAGRGGAPGVQRPLSSPNGPAIVVRGRGGGPGAAGGAPGSRPLPTPGGAGPTPSGAGVAGGAPRGAPPRGGAGGSVRGRPLPTVASSPALTTSPPRPLSSSPSSSSSAIDVDSNGFERDHEDTDGTDSSGESSSPPSELSSSSSSSAAGADSGPKSDLEKKLWHRAQVLKEILTTEIDYVRDLETVVTVFLKPIKERKMLPDTEIASIFSDIELIVTVNRAVCLEFEKANEKQAADPDKPLLLGDIFLRLSDCFKMYTNYCTNQPIAMGVLDRCQKKYPIFDKFLKDCMEDGACRGLSLLSFLIKPVQRICKYPLLLRDLIKDTPEDHPDLGPLQQAFEKIEKVVEYVNERKRHAEILQKTFQIQEQIEGGEKLDLVGPGRKFVRDGLFNIYVRNVKREWKIYLFTDLVVITKPKKNIIGQDARDHYKSTVSLGNARLVDLADSGEICNAFELANKSETPVFSYVIQCSSPEEKKEWSREVKTLIRLFQEREAREKKAALKKKASSEGVDAEEGGGEAPPDVSSSSSSSALSRGKSKISHSMSSSAISSMSLSSSSSSSSSFSSASSSPASSSPTLPHASPGVPTIGKVTPGISGRPPPPAGFGRGRPPPPVLSGSPTKAKKQDKEKDKKKDKKKPSSTIGSLPRVVKQPKDFQKELSKALSKPSS